METSVTPTVSSATRVAFDSEPSSSDAPPPPPLPRKKPHRVKGILLLVSSVFLFSLMALAVKLNGSEFGAGEALLFRCTIQTFCSWLMCVIMKIPLWGAPGKTKQTMARGYIGSFATLLFFGAIVNLPLGDATAIFFTSPIWSATFSYFIFKEPVTRKELLAVFCAIIGVIFVSRPTFIFPEDINDSTQKNIILEPNHLHYPFGISRRTLGIVSGICGAACAGFVPITVRLAGPTVHWCSLNFTFGFFGILISLIDIVATDPGTIPFSRWPSPYAEAKPYIIFIIGGISSTGAASLFNAGMQLETPTTSSLVRTLDVVLGATYQTLVVGNALAWSSLFGMCLIISSTVMLLFAKMRMKGKGYEKVGSQNILCDDYGRPVDANAIGRASEILELGSPRAQEQESAEMTPNPS